MRKEIQQKVTIDACDWCQEPMDKYDIHDGTFHHPNKAHIVSGYISHPVNGRWVNQFRFLWRRDGKREVTYDFHTRCFDEMVKEALANKKEN